MAAPYPLLIKKKTSNGTETSVINTETVFGMVCSGIPFHFIGEVKDLPENDWYDEDGLDSYLPDSGLFIKEYDIEVEFIYKGIYNSFASHLRSFISYLSGKDGLGSSLTIYDGYNNVGRQDVRLVGVDNDVFIKQRVSNSTNQEIATFKVTFKVCDPVTDIILGDSGDAGTDTQINYNSSQEAIVITPPGSASYGNETIEFNI